MKSCHSGRQYNPEHPTCVSCERQIGSCPCKKKRRRKPPESLRVWFEGKSFYTNALLRSMNYWHGRPRGVYLQYKKQWRTLLAGTIHLWGKPSSPRHLEIIRVVSQRGHLIQDTIDNLNGAVKPVKDILVAEGVLTDDTDEHVTVEVHQELGPKRYTKITIKEPNND